MELHITGHLEETFGKIPKFIEENLKYLSYDEDEEEFTCIPCNKIIRKIEGNESSTLANFKSHLLSRSHAGISISVITLWQTLKEIFHGRAGIPQLVCNNLQVLGMVKQNYLCVICDKHIIVTKCIEMTERNFLQHLLSRAHLDGLETFRGVLRQVTDVFGGVPEVVQNNQAFLKVSRSGRSYDCVLCNKKLMVHPTDLEETEHNFEKHLYSLKHIEHLKQIKGFDRLPQLKTIYDDLPNYILRSIEYFSFNEKYLFCSLCNTNVKFIPNDIYLSDQCLRLHLLGDGHLLKLKYRKDSDENKVYKKLKTVFSTFEDDILEELETLSLVDGSLGCGLCNEVLEYEDDPGTTKWNIINHFGIDGTGNHADKLHDQLTKNSNVKASLVEVFGGLPDTLVMQNNLSYIKYRGMNEFECVPCGAILQAKNSGEDYETNERITEENFKKHLNSKTHFQLWKESITGSEILYNELDTLCSDVPQYIISNEDHLRFGQSEEEFICLLCDVRIPVIRGPRSAEVTLLNLRTHLFSPDHSRELKTKADKYIETEEELKTIFGGIPEFILANIDHIYEDSDGLFCYTCDARLDEGSTSFTTEMNFRKHLSGSSHRKAVRDADFRHQEAFRRLDSFFPRIPEFLLRQLDFLNVFGMDLHCDLCQLPLPIDCSDLIYAREVLRSHMNSEKHINNLSSV